VEAMKANWSAVRRTAEGGVAVVPLGSLEAHGRHLPCGTDSLLVEGIVAAAVADSDPARVVVFPTVHYNVVEWARPMASAGVSPLQLVSQLVDTARDIHGLGFRKIVFVNGHGNMPAAQLAVWQLLREGAGALYVDCCPSTPRPWPKCSMTCSEATSPRNTCMRGESSPIDDLKKPDIV